MKWFFLILTMAVKRFAHIETPHEGPVQEIKELIKENAIKISLAATAASALGTLFVAGIVMTVINLTTQYDEGLQPRFTAPVAGGLGIILASLIIFAIGIFVATSSERNHKKALKEREKNQGQTLQQALILLINDFIEHREAKRKISHTLQNEMENSYLKNEEQQRH